MTHPIGIIGGSGLYTMSGVHDTTALDIQTPFGPPSDSLVMGTLEGVSVASLARHGLGHRILPGEVNYRANLWALKSVTRARVAKASSASRASLASVAWVIPT